MNRQLMTIEMINVLGLTVEDVMKLTDLSKATVNKFMKNGKVAGRTLCLIWDEVKVIDEDLKIKMLNKYGLEY